MFTAILSPLQENYLVESAYVNYNNPNVQREISSLLTNCKSSTEYLTKAFLFVRDHISHSVDKAEKTIISRSASDALKNKHGLCFAKAHLLCALLRAVKIPCALSYQTIISPSIRFIHGLCAYLDTNTHSWVHIDPVNKNDKFEAFKAGHEWLYYRPSKKLTIINHPELYTDTHPAIKHYLEKHSTLSDALEELPESLSSIE